MPVAATFAFPDADGGPVRRDARLGPVRRDARLGPVRRDARLDTVSTRWSTP